MNYLDFEKPIAQLEAKLQEMRALAEENGVNVDDQIHLLENKVIDLKKDLLSKLTPWQRIQLSRHPDRPYTLDYIQAIADDFIEIHGDRNVRDDKAMVGGLASIDGQTFMIIGQQKGRNTKQRQERNFGMANPEGYRKALRMMKIAEKFNKPVVTFIDTPGAFPGLEAEERGQAEAIAKNIQEMVNLKVPVICVIIGEGASGGAIGIGVGDKVFMLKHTWYSVISPESCSTILWRNQSYKERAAEALKLTAEDMLKNKLIDEIIPEPLGGAHFHPVEMAETLKNHILKEYKKLAKRSPEKRIEDRIKKFERMGEFVEV